MIFLDSLIDDLCGTEHRQLVQIHPQVANPLGLKCSAWYRQRISQTRDLAQQQSASAVSQQSIKRIGYGVSTG